MQTDLCWENVKILPVLHYNMECAAEVCKLASDFKPDCIAVELPEGIAQEARRCAGRLPDITIIALQNGSGDKIYYLAEPCDPCFEALRMGLHLNADSFCIDLSLKRYPDVKEYFPDPYAIHRVGLKNYYELYQKAEGKPQPLPEDLAREQHMAKRVKELSFQYERVLFVCGMFHAERIAKFLAQSSFPNSSADAPYSAELFSPTEKSLREVMGEFGYLSERYEQARSAWIAKEDPEMMPDRQKMIFDLFKAAGKEYQTERGASFPGYNLRNAMKFCRNYARLHGMLLPDLFKIITSAKGCVDSHYAYHVWKLATDYSLRRNIDNLPEVEIAPEDIWGGSKRISFQLKPPSRKAFQGYAKKADKSKIKFFPPGPFSICSYPPEDLVIENFGKFLQKKGVLLCAEEGARTIPFSTSLEDGIDTKETIRHFGEKKLYVKTSGKPAGQVGSVVVIFDEDQPAEKYPWKTTWIGEHNQESDMAFYATSLKGDVIGPGISRCTYGGFMMSYPPRRLYDVWSDPDYEECRTKAEVLLAAAIDYSLQPLVVYAAPSPPRSALKSFARKYGKKLVYLPLSQLSPTTLNKLRTFHVLDGHDRRGVASEFID